MWPTVGPNVLKCPDDAHSDMVYKVTFFPSCERKSCVHAGAEVLRKHCDDNAE